MHNPSPGFHVNRYSVVYLLAVFFIFSCGNSIKEVEAINATSETPEEKLQETRMVYTDSGRLKAVLVSPEVQHFTRGRKGFLFPQGLQVEFYDRSGNVEARVNSKFGEYNEEAGELELRKKIKFVNFKEADTLYTEHLIWHRKARKVYTPTRVEIRSKQGILEGDSLVANENFTKYTWVNVSGKHYFNASDTTSTYDEQP